MSCYNARRWLHDAVDSILTQTFGDFELILVDDGSTDETGAIIRQYGDRDARIVALSKKNTGLAHSLNTGMAQARGSWIARLDADDLYEKTCLEEQGTFLRRHPEVVLLGGGFTEIDGQGRVSKTHRYPVDHRELVRHLETGKRFFPHSSAIFRRDTAQAVGGYNRRFRKSQDWDLWLRLAERGQIACLPEPLVRVRKHEDQIQNSAAGVSQLVYAAAATACHFLRLGGYPDPSTAGDERVWQEFIAWVERRLTETGTLARRQAWTDARAAFFATDNRLAGGLRFGTRLLRSGYAGALIYEKYFGTLLAQRLAQDWMTP